MSAALNSPWSLSIAVLTLLLSVELVDIRSSLEPCTTTHGRSEICYIEYVTLSSDFSEEN